MLESTSGAWGGGMVVLSLLVCPLPCDGVCCADSHAGALGLRLGVVLPDSGFAPQSHV